jgi:hypothetical protein
LQLTVLFADYLQPLRLDPERPGDEFGFEKFRLMIAAGQRMNSRDQKGGLPVTRSKTRMMQQRSGLLSCLLR